MVRLPGEAPERGATMNELETKLETFRATLETAQLEGLIRHKVDCEANRLNAKCSVKLGGKYARVDCGSSGMYMVILATGEIYGIKAYGVIHRGHFYGTLDTLEDYDWSGYRAIKKREAT